MTRYDRLLFGRVVVLSGALLSVAAAVLVATDEPTSSLGDRAARLAMLAPLVGALSAAIVAHSAARRGDTAALVSLGAHPLRAGAGLIVGAALVGLLGAVAIGVGVGSLGALFPALPSSPWAASADGFVALGTGVVLRVDDVVFDAPVALSASTPSRLAAAGFAFVAALVLPPWAVAPAPRAAKAAVLGASVVAAIVAFHGVAVGRSPASLPWALAPVALHLAWLAARNDLLPSRA